MSHFKLREFDISSEPIKESEKSIVELEPNVAPKISKFEFAPFKTKQSTMTTVIKNAGSHADKKKDQRFSINPLMRDTLSLEEEQRREMEEKINVRVKELAIAAQAKAEAQGYQDGLQKGIEETYQRLRAEKEESLARFDSFLNEAEQAKEVIFQANERFLIEMVFRIAKMVTLKELSTDKEYILRLAKELVNRVGVKEQIKILIHPDDAGIVQVLNEGFEQQKSQMKNFAIELSGAVSPGGCKVETEWSLIDANIDSQLEGIHSALIGQEREQKA